MRRFLPTTLPVWVLMIVIAGLLFTQVASLVIIYHDRSSSDEVIDLYRLNERAFWLAKLMYSVDSEERKKISAGLTNSTLAVNLASAPIVTANNTSSETLSELEDIIAARLSKFDVIDARIRLDPAASPSPALSDVVSTEPDANDVEDDFAVFAQDLIEADRYTVSIQFKDGQWLNFSTPVTPPGPILTARSLPVYGLVALCVIFVSMWAIRKLTAPYRLLEEAVTRLRDDFKHPPLPENGGKEYASAARAVNQMQTRLLEYVEDREYLAAALAHDLRTPITRMRLRLEQLRKSPVRDAFGSDIASIETTVQSVIDLAQMQITEEELERLEFWSMVESIADDYPAATIEAPAGDRARLICLARPTALRRCIKNLLENAINYGKNARLTVSTAGDMITLEIADDGPGIPEAKMESVFRPFVRLEHSRSRDTGGSGLGLTIARGLARKMGGDVSISNRPSGGLVARLSIRKAMR
ncbi:MAG: HAMP domain-containing histidine kinase [Rhizobiaceae bacterium]|nr:HAMP domain-containing histidine kinase [Rhizobiaceae bacterium]